MEGVVRSLAAYCGKRVEPASIVFVDARIRETSQRGLVLRWARNTPARGK